MTPSKPVDDTTRVLFIAAEADPLVKVGGLGDVAGSLPAALRALSPSANPAGRLDVRLAIPFHAAIDRSALPIQWVKSFPIPHEPQPFNVDVYQTEVGDLPVYLIAGLPIPSSGPVYSLDANEDTSKYAFFSLAALEMARQLDWQPHILHANDWHTALAVYALDLIRPEDSFFGETHSVLTVHNLPFMGAPLDQVMREYDLPPAMDNCLPDWARRLPLPLGLLTADRIIAVSPHYAEEIQTPAFGCGLQDFLMGRKESLLGILNGIDTDAWNPLTDPLIPQRFGPADLNQRRANKARLLCELGLDQNPSLPLLGLISRMDPQKGIDLVPEGLRLTAEVPWQAVLLGTGVPDLEKSIQNLEEHFPGRIRSLTRFDPVLARKIYAGADVLMMPSRYEPCGLAQMIAMRYGCVPFARATGGLKDTICDSPDGNQNTGYLFEETTPQAFSAALKRALADFARPDVWRQLQLNGMRQEFSWEKSALEYARIYAQLRK